MFAETAATSPRTVGIVKKIKEMDTQEATVAGDAVAAAGEGEVVVEDAADIKDATSIEVISKICTLRSTKANKRKARKTSRTAKILTRIQLEILTFHRRHIKFRHVTLTSRSITH